MFPIFCISVFFDASRMIRRSPVSDNIRNRDLHVTCVSNFSSCDSSFIAPRSESYRSIRYSRLCSSLEDYVLDNAQVTSALRPRSDLVGSGSVHTTIQSSTDHKERRAKAALPTGREGETTNLRVFLCWCLLTVHKTLPDQLSQLFEKKNYEKNKLVSGKI